jgi:predicted  nucleic acid-binding Zn-ribbon protein
MTKTRQRRARAQINVNEQAVTASASPSTYVGAGKIANETALSNGDAAETAEDPTPNHADEAVDDQVSHTRRQAAISGLKNRAAKHVKELHKMIDGMCTEKDMEVQSLKEEAEAANNEIATLKERQETTCNTVEKLKGKRSS